MGAGGAGQIAAMDDPRIHLPVVRGPMPFGTTVHDQVLDPTRGPLSGSAGLERDFPLLPTLGPYRINAEEFLLDREWQHREMGLWTTRDRRIPVIYDLAQADASYTNAYVAAAVAIVYAPFRPNLYPLDRDDEFIYYSRRFANVPTFPYRGAPDFHPVLNLPCSWSCESGCRADHEFVRRQVEDLVDRIRGNKSKDPPVSSLPERMAGAFRSLYRAVQDQLNDQINATPPPSPAAIAAMQAEIAQLQHQDQYPRTVPLNAVTLAQRITAWTSKGILTAVIVVAGLGFGRQVLRWWANDRGETEPAMSEMAVDSADDRRDPARLLAVRHSEMVDRAGGRSRGRGRTPPGRCERACRESDRPRQAAGRCPGAVGDAAPGHARRPATGGRGAGPVAAGRAGRGPADGRRHPAGGSRRHGAGGNPCAGTSRVVLWGLALPASPQSWTLYTCVSGSPSVRTGVRRRSMSRLPPTARRSCPFRPTTGDAWRHLAVAWIG